MTIIAHNLTKQFTDVIAVHDLSLAISRGEIYGLIGPNGAGKTTALRMLTGLMKPTSGTILIDEIDLLTDTERAKGHLGFSTASMGLYARLTPLELLRYFGKLYGLSSETCDINLHSLAHTLDFTSFLNQRCGQLSHGQRQRIALARACIHNPSVIILDEPTAGLDVLASQAVAHFVKHLRNEGKAIVFSTHYMTEAELLCNRIGFLYQGKLMREGTSDDLKAHYQAPSLEGAFLNMIAQGAT